MALMKCKECGNEVSTSAGACPKCGAPVVLAPNAAKRIGKGVGLGCAGALVVVAILVGIGTATKNSADKAAAQVGALEQRAATATESSPDIHAVALATLLADYKSNEIRADGLYKDKWIQVTGVVGDVKKDILNDPFVTVGTGAQFEIPVLQCTLSKAAVERASRLSKGDAITIRGKVSGLMMNVLAKDCGFP